MLSDTALNEFKAIYKKEYGVDLSDAEAAALAVSLLTLMNQIYRPIKKSWLAQPRQLPADQEPHI